MQSANLVQRLVLPTPTTPEPLLYARASGDVRMVDNGAVLSDGGTLSFDTTFGVLAAGPGDLATLAKFKQHFELFLEQRVVVAQVMAEEGEAFDQAAASGPDRRGARHRAGPQSAGPDHHRGGTAGPCDLGRTA